MENSEVKAVQLDYNSLNAMINILGKDGKLQLEKDKEAAKQYFLEHVNKNMQFFHNLKEKLDYLVENDYYDKDLIEKYEYQDIKDLFKYVYSFKFRFPSFVGAYKFYSQYALRTNDKQRYLERYEDRICMVALYLAQGDIHQAKEYATELINGRFQPATPTFLNAGKKYRGELVSCFLLHVADNFESIGRSIQSALQLSKRGGGVALNLTDIREKGAPIKNVHNASSGVIPIMKIYEDSFSYANQLG